MAKLEMKTKRSGGRNIVGESSELSALDETYKQRGPTRQKPPVFFLTR